MRGDIVRESNLTREEVGSASQEVEAFLEKSDADEAVRMRVRFTMEDMLLRVCEELGEETPYKLVTGTVFGRRFIRVSYTGTAYNPSSASEDPSENWSNRIMSDMGLSPVWRYQNGINTLELKLKRKDMGNLGRIILAMVLALACGFGGIAVLPEAVRTYVCELFFKPFQSIFFKLLSVFAGFMILLAISCGIFNMGDTSSFSRIGKNMLRRFVGFTVLLAAAESVICYFLFPTVAGEGGSVGIDPNGLADVLKLIYDIVPGDPISPFATGNAMQIVLLGVVIGVALLLAGEKMEHVRVVAEEANSLITGILSGVCRLLPFYIFFLLTDMIWSGTFRLMINIWKPFVATASISMLLLVGMILYVSVKYKANAIVIARKLLPTFVICFSSASCISAFNQTMEDSTQKFGVDEKYVKVALPIRSIIYMPALVTELIVLIYSMAQIYGVQTGITWIILGIMISSILAMAVPPIPGAVAMIFGILFSQVGIPTEAMVFAVTCDVFYDFLDAAVNNSVGILEFALQADKLDMLDRDKLRKPEKR